MQTIIHPQESDIGCFYGTQKNSPTIGKPLVVIVTRITKTRVFARRVATTEIIKPQGSLSMDANQILGIEIIETPIRFISEEYSFVPHNNPYFQTKHIQGRVPFHCSNVHKGKCMLFLCNFGSSWETQPSNASIFAATALGESLRI